MVHESLLRWPCFGRNTQRNPWAATLVSDTVRHHLWKCRVHNRTNTHQLQSTCGLAPRCSGASQPMCLPREAAHERREDPRCHEGSHVPQYAVKDISQYADAPLRKTQDELLVQLFSHTALDSQAHTLAPRDPHFLDLVEAPDQEMRGRYAPE